jgi:hypothetical protein
MFDFSPAGGLKSVLSSFSRTVFSENTIRRVAIFYFATVLDVPICNLLEQRRVRLGRGSVTS